MKKIKIDIPDLLEEVRFNSIYEVAKKYGYSYSTLYREVEKLKEWKEKEYKAKQDKMMMQIAGSDSIVVINKAHREQFKVVELDENLDLDKDLFFLVGSEMTAINCYKIEIEFNNRERSKSMIVEESVFIWLQLANFKVKVCNKVIVDTDRLYFSTDSGKLFFAKFNKIFNVNAPGKISIGNSVRKGDITEIFKKREYRVVEKDGNVFTKAYHIKLTDELYDKLFDYLDVAVRHKDLIVENV